MRQVQLQECAECGDRTRVARSTGRRSAHCATPYLQIVQHDLVQVAVGERAHAVVGLADGGAVMRLRLVHVLPEDVVLPCSERTEAMTMKVNVAKDQINDNKQFLIGQTTCYERAIFWSFGSGPVSPYFLLHLQEKCSQAKDEGCVNKFAARSWALVVAQNLQSWVQVAGAASADVNFYPFLFPLGIRAQVSETSRTGCAAGGQFQLGSTLTLSVLNV